MHAVGEDGTLGSRAKLCNTVLTVNLQAFFSAPVIQETVVRHWRANIEMDIKDIIFGLMFLGLPVALSRHLWDHYDMSRVDEQRSYQGSTTELSKGALNGSAAHYVVS